MYHSSTDDIWVELFTSTLVLQKWGTMMMYRGIPCPCLNVKNFVVTIKEKKFSNYTKWRELPTKFQAFDYIEHANNRLAQLSIDEKA